jgi:hypothetical protein
MKRIFYTLFLGTVIFFSLSARPYTFTEDFNRGFYWAAFPFSMTSFVTNPSDGPVLAEAVANAESAWQSALNKNIWSIPTDAVVSPSYYGNNIRWSVDFAKETGYDPTNTLAVTVRYPVGTYVGKVEIILNSGIAELKQNYYGLLDKTILHEMGHTFGLGHSTVMAIMQPVVGGLSNLTSDDITGGTAVLAETKRRQDTHYVSPNASDNNAMGACGTIVDQNDTNGKGFLLSLGLGLLLSFSILLSKRRTWKSNPTTSSF